MPNVGVGVDKEAPSGLSEFALARKSSPGLALDGTEKSPGGSAIALLETAIDAVVGMDRTGRITDWNRAAEKMFGQSRSEVLGKVLAEVIVPPSLRAAHQAGIARYLAAGETRILGKRVLLSALRRNGTTFPVELAIAHYDNPGAPEAADSRGTSIFIGFIRDISERQESAHFRLLVEAVKDYAIFMLDPQGRVATWNAGAQAFKGYTPEEILGQHFSVFYSAQDRKDEKPANELLIAQDVGRFQDEGWRVRKDGTQFWANILITAMRDEAGKLIGFAKVTRDLTELRHAEKLDELEVRHRSQLLEDENRRMHEANRLKSEFLANMSHELRTPLNAITGFAELMHKGKVGPVSDDHKEYLGDILDSARHLLKLINEVLDLAKIESGEMEFHPEQVELSKVVAEVCDILRGLASTKRIRLEIRVDATAAPVLDPLKLKQVLYNYLSNALKFTPEGGRVTVRAFAETGDLLRVEVEDTGIGIRPEDTSRLFVEFQQLDAGMAKKYAGTGLGLALTKRIIEAQGGRVGVTSALGSGSTFWALLPCRARDVEITSPVEGPGPLPPPAMTRTVVVVDDDPTALRLLGATLKSIGCSTVTFKNPRDALRTLGTMRPAVVVLDLLMPDMNGFELLDRLRRIPHMRNVPVVVWTSSDLTGFERRHLLTGAQSIVSKGQGDGEAIINALRPYLTNLPGDQHAR